MLIKIDDRWNKTKIKMDGQGFQLLSDSTHFYQGLIIYSANNGYHYYDDYLNSVINDSHSTCNYYISNNYDRDLGVYNIDQLINPMIAVADHNLLIDINYDFISICLFKPDSQPFITDFQRQALIILAKLLIKDYQLNTSKIYPHRFMPGVSRKLAIDPEGICDSDLHDLIYQITK